MTENALNKIMSVVTDRRVVFDFCVAEKVSYTHRVEATTWKEAEEKLDEGDYEIIDGSHEYLHSYRPTREERVKEVKIGYRWYNLSDIVYDPDYYLENEWNIRDAYEDSLEVA